MSKPKYHRPRTICRECGKDVALKAPTGSWLDALLPIAHKQPNGEQCDGQYREHEIVSEHKVIEQ